MTFHRFLIVFCLCFSLGAHAEQARGPHGVDQSSLPAAPGNHPEGAPLVNKPGAPSPRDQAEALFREYKTAYASLAEKLRDWETTFKQLEESGHAYPIADPLAPDLDLDELVQGLRVARRLLADPLPGSELIPPARLATLHDLNGQSDKSSATAEMIVGLAMLRELHQVADFAESLNAQVFDNPEQSAPKVAQEAALRMEAKYGKSLFDRDQPETVEAAAKRWILTVRLLREAYERPLDARDAAAERARARRRARRYGPVQK